MLNASFTNLELRAIERVCDGLRDATRHAIERQLAAARVVSRTMHSTGFTTRLQVVQTCKPVPSTSPVVLGCDSIAGVLIEFEIGLQDGLITHLDGHTYGGEEFPESFLADQSSLKP